MKKELLEEKLHSINEVLKKEYVNEKEIGILAGLSGISLFHFYYSKYFNKSENQDIGIKILEQCGDKINEGSFRPTYCSGLGGFGWVLEHLLSEGFIDADSNLPLELDEYLYKMMVLDMERGNYDFLHGGLGYAFYFLKKFKNTTSIALKEKYKSMLSDFISLLKKIAIKVGDNEFKWESIVNKTEDKRAKVYNLGLSHGMSSIVGILTKLYEIDDFKDSAEEMLKGAINYIDKYKVLDKENTFLFPNWVDIEIESRGGGRLAWCYGDLGIGIRMWYASKVLNDFELKNKALVILRHSAKITKPNKTLVRDAGICHGSFGNALIFQRMYEETNENIFKSATDFWINDGLEKASFKDGHAGFKQVKIGEETYKSISMLEGIAGIGLVIINYITDNNDDWDECLLIS